MKRKRAARVTVAMALVLAACGGGEADPPEETSAAAPTTTAAPATTVATTAAPETTPPTTEGTAPPTTEATTTTTTEAPRELECPADGAAVGDGCLVEAGRYVTDRAGTPLVFDLTEPVGWVELEDLVLFQHPELSEQDIVAVAGFVGIISAGEIGTHPPHDPPIPVNTVDIPADMGDWFAEAAQVVVDGSGEVPLASGSVPYWDISVDTAAGDTFSCFLGDCVANFVPGDGNGAWVFSGSYSFRIYQLNGEMEGLFAFVQAHPENFEAVTSLSELVVGGMSIAG